MVGKGTVFRAFELAGSGAFSEVRQIERQLRVEGYANVLSHLEGRTTRRQLLAMMRNAVAAPATDVDQTTGGGVDGPCLP